MLYNDFYSLKAKNKQTNKKQTKNKNKNKTKQKQTQEFTAFSGNHNLQYCRRYYEMNVGKHKEIKWLVLLHVLDVYYFIASSFSSEWYRLTTISYYTQSS